jgi:hypothetical protein
MDAGRPTRRWAFTTDGDEVGDTEFRLVFGTYGCRKARKKTLKLERRSSSFGTQKNTNFPRYSWPFKISVELGI